jgi:hypothetical protein
MGVFKDKINDPYDTMGTGSTGAKTGKKAAPADAAQRDTNRRKSSWLKTKQADHPGTPACKECKGTGSSGWKTAKGETIVCPSCRGFGY